MKVYVVSIDIKDGWYDIIHAFHDETDAQAYVLWQDEHGGDHCYYTEVEVADAWVPPSPAEQESLF